jgi:signal transduction histidine kinase
MFRRSRFRTWPVLRVVLPLVLTLGVTGVLAWSVGSARRAHRSAAEETARDYATFAATLAAAHARAALDQVLLYAFYAADLAEQRDSRDPVLPTTLASNPPESERCADHYPEGRWFVRAGSGGDMDVAGPLEPGLGRWLADTLAALQNIPGAARQGNFFPTAGEGLVVAYRLRRDAEGRSVEAHALAHCFESQDGSVFGDAGRRFPLLPPAAGAGADSLITLTVTDPRGRTVYRSSGARAVRPGSGFTGARPPDRSGPLEGLVFTVSVPPSLAHALVAGGIPASGGRAPWLLVLLAAALGAATFLQLHRALALVRTRERFVANVSHELRTPLQLVLLFAQLLRLGRAGSPREREEALTIIEREARRLVGLVERVLAFAGGGGTEADAERAERLDVSRVARETVEAFRPLADAEEVTLDVVLDDDLPPVLARPGELRQIILNLLDNALRHGPPGQRIAVRAAAGNGRVDLLIDDEGPGIPPGERERVWEPFYRIGAAAPRGTEGSGIGLAVVRDAVRSMGGSVWIEDAPGPSGAGTRVVVRIPVSSPQPGREVEA